MDSLNNENIKVPYMRDLSQFLNKMVEKGYTENFKADEKGIIALSSSKHYAAEDMKVVNFYRFEGISDPDDNSILYVIETNDGTKGTLTDAYGAYSDPNVAKVMSKVAIQEKT